MTRPDMLSDPGDEAAWVEGTVGIELPFQFLHQSQRRRGRPPHVHCVFHLGWGGREHCVSVVFLRQCSQAREPRGDRGGSVEGQPHRPRAGVGDVADRATVSVNPSAQTATVASAACSPAAAATRPSTTVTAAGVRADPNSVSISDAVWASEPRAAIVPAVSGSGVILNVTSVMTPSVPSEPTKSLHMS